ncbi:ATP-binding protein [Brachyspira suanatina]|uniref:ATP-binding protein n=1 Tax=Brachyspira suanatina TaxID=381802 RepID=A0A0G4KAD6_9SPIR|nr:AAA family ATPase [Brachyspira suanatina]CRF35205.1 ATP-binding protein [Brachyspira suanatina]
MNKTKTSDKKVSSKNNIIENVKISNFTVFKNAEINFSKGLSVFIGKNGTGKTHLLKLINCLDYNFYDDKLKIEYKKSYPISFNLNKIFSKYSCKNINEEIYKISEIIGTKKNKELNKNIFLSFTEPNIFIEFNNNIKLNSTMTDFEGSGYDNLYNIIYHLNENSKKYLNKKSTFIPCKDILTSSNGFAALYDKRDINFEAVYYNTIKKTELPKLRELDNDLLEIAKKIENAIGGKTIYKNNNFFIDYKNIGEVSFDIVAEGHKKLALIYILIVNGEIDKNTILLLDEPESNLNPSLTDLLVNILLSLSKLGFQNL